MLVSHFQTDPRPDLQVGHGCAATKFKSGPRRTLPNVFRYFSLKRAARLLRSSLPRRDDWRYDLLESNRAHDLVKAHSSKTVLDALENELFSAVDRKDVRFGYEDAKSGAPDARLIVQFPVSARSFDWFFNARTGYRAHFRGGYALGLKFNDDVISRLRAILRSRVSWPAHGRRVDIWYHDLGSVPIQKAFFEASLISFYSKIWLCGIRLEGNGKHTKMPIGAGDFHLLVDGEKWMAMAPGATWLEVKGAFTETEGNGQPHRRGEPYQSKDPVHRARTLQFTGEA